MVCVGHTLLLTNTVLGFRVRLDHDTSVVFFFFGGGGVVAVVLKRNCFPAACNFYLLSKL